MLIKDEIININGKELLLRNATEEDAQILIDYLKVTCAETKNLVKEPEEVTMTLEQEQDFIDYNNRSANSLLLLGFLDGEHVGNCSLIGSNRFRYRHRITMGIALYQKFIGMGIGRTMIEKLITIAREKGYEQMELEVVADNERAIHLYKSLGFEIYGTLPDQMKYKDGSYADVYWMMKKL